MWLTDLKLVDPRTGSIVKVDIEVQGDRVARLSERAPGGSTRLSLKGAYVLPGLTSCHTHLQAVYPYELRDEREPVSRTALRAAWRARETLSAGITTVRCLHEQQAVDVELRDAIASGRAVGPRIFAAGRALTTTGGHASALGCRTADGADGFLAAGRTELAGGANHLKVMASGGLAGHGESLDEPQMTLAEMTGAVTAAEQHGTYVAAHAAGSKTIQRGLEAGIRSFEHAYRLDADTATHMAQAGAFLTPTLVVTHVHDWMGREGFGEQAIARSQLAADEHRQSVQAAIAAKVTLVNGTDFPPGSSDRGVPLAIREMELMVEAGLEPIDAIRAATVNAASLLRATSLGVIQEGGFADLVAVDGDPVADIAAMERIFMVMKGGQIVRNDPPGSAWA